MPGGRERAVARFDPRYTETLPATAELVIIGGGIIGVATAYFAARAGLNPVVLEKQAMPGTLTTPKATGAFRAQFDNPDEMALVREGIDFYADFGNRTGMDGYDLGIQQQGYLWLARSEKSVARQRELVAEQRGWGLADVELLDGDEARRRFPYLSGDVLGARYREGDGWLDVRRLMMGYVRASQTPIVLRTEVTGIQVTGGRVSGVVTNRGVISTERVVIAAGPFSAEVGRLAGIDLPITCVRRQRLILPEAAGVPRDAPMTIDEETGAHWRPWLAGAHLMWTTPTEPAAAPLEDVPTNLAFAYGLLDPASDHAVAHVSPFWRDVWLSNTSHWLLVAGQYSYTPDHRPLLGASPVDGLYLNCGYSGHGIMGSAGGSRLTVDMITGAVASAQNSFRPDRQFAERALDVL
jgi:glycine/D-amino acid oxidase-like deaminating enzyme